MRFSLTTHYPADVEAVMAVIGDPAFQEAKCVATAAGAHEARVERAGDRVTAYTTRRFPTDAFPDVARRVVGDTLVIEEVQEWGAPGADGTRRCRISLRAVGTPVTLQGQATLTPTDEGCREDIEADLRAGVPLIGGRLERAAEPLVHHAMDIETGLIGDWLERR